VEATSGGTDKSPGVTREREREKGEREKGERRKKGRAPVQVFASYANRTGMTESRRLLQCNWWTRSARWLDC
jgi:hypothetical protein